MRLRGRLDGRRIVPYYDRAEIEAGPRAAGGPGNRVGGRSGRALLPADPGLGAHRARHRRDDARGLCRAERPSLPLDRPAAGRARRAAAREGLDAGHQGVGARQPGQADRAAQPERELRVLPRAAGRPARARPARWACRSRPAAASRSIRASSRSARPSTSPRRGRSPTSRSTSSMLAQDTGGAIRGAVRADFFWGFGEDAAREAGRMKQPLRMWVLLPKGYAQPRIHADNTDASGDGERRFICVIWSLVGVLPVSAGSEAHAEQQAAPHRPLVLAGGRKADRRRDSRARHPPSRPECPARPRSPRRPRPCSSMRSQSRRRTTASPVPAGEREPERRAGAGIDVEILRRVPGRIDGGGQLRRMRGRAPFELRVGFDLRTAGSCRSQAVSRPLEPVCGRSSCDGGMRGATGRRRCAPSALPMARPRSARSMRPRRKRGRTDRCAPGQRRKQPRVRKNRSAQAHAPAAGARRFPCRAGAVGAAW